MKHPHPQERTKPRMRAAFGPGSYDFHNTLRRMDPRDMFGFPNPSYTALVEEHRRKIARGAR